MTAKPNELTPELFKHRIKTGLLDSGVLKPGEVTDAIADAIFGAGKFSELVGTVERATMAERERCAQVARRRQHPETAMVILNYGKPKP